MSIKTKETEAHVKKAIRKAILEMFPDAWEVMVVPTGYGVRGIPDHLVCAPIVITEDMVGQSIGVLMGIEAKGEKGKLAPLQIIQLNKIKAASGHTEVVYGTKDVPRMISRIEQRYGLHK